MDNSSKILRVMLLLVFGLLLSSTITLASVYDDRHIELLAVQTLDDGTTIGKSADLFLQVRDGSGRVFLDTTPLTKIDTQATTRYAKEMACEYFSLDCERYDFFFTIRSDTSIIGGPSAGAATAALTAIAVMDLQHDNTIAVTGTINSGGTVGPVGGVKSKIEAAKSAGLSKVLVPLGALREPVEINSSLVHDWRDNYYSNSYQNQINYYQSRTSAPAFLLKDYAAYVLGIEAVEVVDLSDLIFELTGENYSLELGELTVDEQYIEIMKGLDNDLCERSNNLIVELENFGELEPAVELRIESYLNNSLEASEIENYYASASACFGANVYLQYQIYEVMNLSSDDFSLEVEKLGSEISLFQIEVESKELLTISDLQAKMVVKERLREASEYLSIAIEENSTYALAYGNERIISAHTWSAFFSMEGKKLDLSLDSLQNACYAKVLEAQERYRYATLFFEGFDLQYMLEKIENAQVAWEAGDYELCIVQAAQGKAEASSIVSSIGLGTSVPVEYLDTKRQAALRTLVHNTKNNQFPILGYSYYMFAQNLEEDSPYSALLYYEYALEMSELNVYFSEKTESIGFFGDIFSKIGLNSDSRVFLNGFFQGLLMGILIMWIYLNNSKEKKKRK